MENIEIPPSYFGENSPLKSFKESTAKKFDTFFDDVDMTEDPNIKENLLGNHKGKEESEINY